MADRDDQQQGMTDTVTDQPQTESRKRLFSDKSESTGESPDAKRLISGLMGFVDMPPDDAPQTEWFKALFASMKQMYHQNEDLKDSLNFYIRETAQHKGEIEQVKGETEKLKIKVNNLEAENMRLRAQCSVIGEEHLKTELKLREYNLVFDGIIETYGETSAFLHRKLANVLNHMVVFNNCGLQVPLRKIERVGPFVKGQTRPVLVQFSSYSDIDLLLHNRMQLPKDVFVREDFPQQIEMRRRILRPIFNKARKMPQYKGKCRLTFDKLIIEGKCYTVEPVNNLDQLPHDLNPRSAAERENVDVIVFFTQGSPFSNFHHAPFVKDNQKYFCNEQYIQASKASLFQDDVTHSKIMQSINPYDIKKLGSQVKNFVRERWEQAARKVAFDCCLAKFTQNSHVLQALLETKDKTIGEASKDAFWGIGKSLNDTCVLEKNWEGKNLLGEVLMEIREQLKTIG